jgi:hypothetical protein
MDLQHPLQTPITVSLMLESLTQPAGGASLLHTWQTTQSGGVVLKNTVEAGELCTVILSNESSFPVKHVV